MTWKNTKNANAKITTSQFHKTWTAWFMFTYSGDYSAVKIGH